MNNKVVLRGLITLTVILNLIYIWWRTCFTIPSNQTFIGDFFAIGLLLVEILGLFELYTHFYGLVKRKIPDCPQINEVLFPHVDVFIATYNEPVELLQKTVNGCIHMNYPDKNKVHIYICDDGARDEMRDMAKKMGVSYISRQDNQGGKAGNLNHAMSHSTSPLIATFDADMIPMDDFLYATIPYFLAPNKEGENNRNPNKGKVGFIQTPQSFYNLDLFQANLYAEDDIPNEQDYFYRNIQLSRNSNNTPIYGGSNTVISREALLEVGGFYTESITEDFATGMLIQSKGYSCYALPTVHASGMSPTDLKSLFKQRERWARGCIQTARRMNFLFMKGLSIKQKISYLSSVMYWYSSIKRFFFIMAPIAFSVFRVAIVACSFIEILLFWLPTYLITKFTLNKSSSHVRNTKWSNIYETIMFQSLIPGVILETLGIAKNKFSVTRKDKVENDNQYRLMQSLPFIIYIFLSIIGIYNIILYSYLHQTVTYFVLLYWLVVNLLNLVIALIFLLGRMKKHKEEHIRASVPLEFSIGGHKIKTKTNMVSETGFSFGIKENLYLQQGECITAKFSEVFKHATFSSKVKATFVSQSKNNNHWEYVFQINELTEKEKNNLNYMIHNRLPILPQKMINKSSLLEIIFLNIRRRIVS
ncbi:MAG: glycosyltransferase [Eubacteriales bacterium]